MCKLKVQSEKRFVENQSTALPTLRQSTFLEAVFRHFSILSILDVHDALLMPTMYSTVNHGTHLYTVKIHPVTTMDNASR